MRWSLLGAEVMAPTGVHGQAYSFLEIGRYMDLLIFGILVLVVLLGLGANWLFRQRAPNEIIALRKKLDQVRKKA